MDAAGRTAPCVRRDMQLNDFSDHCCVSGRDKLKADSFAEAIKLLQFGISVSQPHIPFMRVRAKREINYSKTHHRVAAVAGITIWQPMPTSFSGISVVLNVPRHLTDMA